MEETVNYLVVESGSWSSDEGNMLQAGVNEIEGDMRLTGQNFQIVQFHGTGFPGGGDLPVVLTQVMSFYGESTLNLKVRQYIYAFRIVLMLEFVCASRWKFCQHSSATI